MMRAGHPPQNEIGDALGLVEIGALAGRLERRHQRLGQVHVGILAAIGRDRRPIGGELLGARAMRRLPEPPVDDFADVGEQPIGLGMPDDLRARGGEQHEGVAIGELVALARAVVVERPEIAAVDAVAMAIEQRLDAVVDKIVRAGAPEQMADRKAMNHAGGRMERAGALAGDRMARVVKRVEAAGRVERLAFEEREQAVGLAEQPAAVAGVAPPRRGFDRQSAHAVFNSAAA